MHTVDGQHYSHSNGDRDALLTSGGDAKARRKAPPHADPSEAHGGTRNFVHPDRLRVLGWVAPRRRHEVEAENSRYGKAQPETVPRPQTMSPASGSTARPSRRDPDSDPHRSPSQERGRQGRQGKSTYRVRDTSRDRIPYGHDQGDPFDSRDSRARHYPDDLVRETDSRRYPRDRHGKDPRDGAPWERGHRRPHPHHREVRGMRDESFSRENEDLRNRKPSSLHREGPLQKRNRFLADRNPQSRSDTKTTPVPRQQPTHIRLDHLPDPDEDGDTDGKHHHGANEGPSVGTVSGNSSYPGISAKGYVGDEIGTALPLDVSLMNRIRPEVRNGEWIELHCAGQGCPLEG